MRKNSSAPENPMGTTFRPYSPDQELLLPPSLNEWLPEGHLAYFISDVVEELDLCAFYARYEGNGRRNSPFDPRMMLSRKSRLYTVGYCGCVIGPNDDSARQRRLLKTLLPRRLLELAPLLTQELKHATHAPRSSSQRTNHITMHHSTTDFLYPPPRHPFSLYISAVICSDTNPIKKTRIAVVNNNAPMLVNRPSVR